MCTYAITYAAYAHAETESLVSVLLNEIIKIIFMPLYSKKCNNNLQNCQLLL